MEQNVEALVLAYFEGQLEEEAQERRSLIKRWIAVHPGERMLALTRRARRWTMERFKAFILGDSCACCGSRDDLEIDHVKPYSRGHHKARHITKAGLLRGDYQLLCLECNRWKDNGPVCPCKYWDSVSPGWRG